MNQHNDQQQEVLDQMMFNHVHRTYWKRIQPTLIFWLFLFLMLACITYYRVTVDFIFAPHAQIEQPFENNRLP